MDIHEFGVSWVLQFLSCNEPMTRNHTGVLICHYGNYCNAYIIGDLAISRYYSIYYVNGTAQSIVTSLAVSYINWSEFYRIGDMV